MRGHGVRATAASVRRGKQVRLSLRLLGLVGAAALTACLPSNGPTLTFIQSVDAGSDQPVDLAGIGGPMREVYAFVVIEGLTAELVSKAGEAELVFRYQLVNRSDDELELPPNTEYARPYYLFGSAQLSIERLGKDPAIPGISAPFERSDGYYATGGMELVLDFVPGRYKLEPHESVEYEGRLDISSFPPGEYRLTVIYQTLPGDRSPPLELDLSALEFRLDR